MKDKVRTQIGRQITEFCLLNTHCCYIMLLKKNPDLLPISRKTTHVQLNYGHYLDLGIFEFFSILLRFRGRGRELLLEEWLLLFGFLSLFEFLSDFKDVEDFIFALFI